MYSGDWWFKRFGKLGPYDQMIFPSSKETENYKNDISNITEWSSLSKQYILNKHNKLMADRRQIFFLQHTTFQPNEHSEDRVEIIISSENNFCDFAKLT